MSPRIYKRWPAREQGLAAAIFIDGFSGGQLPSKDCILEIRINQNPFSPEYDKLGLGRIEILTKPGADKFHGSGYYNFGDDVWNSRNPYAAQKAPFLLKEYGGSLQGPLSKVASFFLTVDRASIDNGAIINGRPWTRIRFRLSIRTRRCSGFPNAGFESVLASITN
jgi:hypothetical protein